MPSNAQDTKGLLKSALRGDDPVIFFMHKRLTGSRGVVGGPEDLIPIGKAAVLREGTDVTLVAAGIVVNKLIKAADKLAKQGIEAEVIDLRTIFPLDFDTITDSVRKTGRAIVVSEEPPYASVASEIAASRAGGCVRVPRRAGPATDRRAHADRTCAQPDGGRDPAGGARGGLGAGLDPAVATELNAPSQDPGPAGPGSSRNAQMSGSPSAVSAAFSRS